MGMAQRIEFDIVELLFVDPLKQRKPVFMYVCLSISMSAYHFSMFTGDENQ